jgi:DNA-binding response OmpR family regulator
MRILLVEDDEVIVGILEKALTQQNYSVDAAINGQIGWDMVAVYRYDLIILDIVLPKLNGLEFCQRLRAHHDQVPVLLLTARGSSDDKVIGLDAGADDYVVKPFELVELLARIRVLLRRGRLPKLANLEWANLRINPEAREANYGGQLLALTPKEYRLLELFVRNQQRVFSRNDILNHLWSSEASPGEDTVTVHIKDLRRKLKQSGAPSDLIETVYGHGYRLKQLPTSSTPDAEEQDRQRQTRAGLMLVWQKYRGLSCDRLTVLERASLRLLDNAFSDQHQEQALQAAHKLAGALGVFGFAEGSRLAREIEAIFQQTCHRSQAPHAMSLIVALRRELNCPEIETIAPGGTRPLLLVATDGMFVKNIVRLAEEHGMAIALAKDITAAQKLIETSQNVILLQFSLRNATEADLNALAELTNQTPPIPILFLTNEDHLVNRIKAAQLATPFFLRQSFLPEQVLTIVQLSKAIAVAQSP